MSACHECIYIYSTKICNLRCIKIKTELHQKKKLKQFFYYGFVGTTHWLVDFIFFIFKFSMSQFQIFFLLLKLHIHISTANCFGGFKEKLSAMAGLI